MGWIGYFEELCGRDLCRTRVAFIRKLYGSALKPLAFELLPLVKPQHFGPRQIGLFDLARLHSMVRQSV